MFRPGSPRMTMPIEFEGAPNLGSPRIEVAAEADKRLVRSAALIIDRAQLASGDVLAVDFGRLSYTANDTCSVSFYLVGVWAENA